MTKNLKQEEYFSMMKLERIVAEIEKTKETISKQQGRLRELEAQKPKRKTCKSYKWCGRYA